MNHYTYDLVAVSKAYSSLPENSAERELFFRLFTNNFILPISHNGKDRGDAPKQQATDALMEKGFIQMVHDAESRETTYDNYSPMLGIGEPPTMRTFEPGPSSVLIQMIVGVLDA